LTSSGLTPGVSADMQRFKKPASPHDDAPQAWEHLNNFLENYLHHAWALVIALTLLGLYLRLPDALRLSIWQTLSGEKYAAQRYLAGMLFFFSLLSLSLLWSGGQRLDAWLFDYINWRGSRPPWLDGLMWVITQTGNGFLALLGALYFWFMGDKVLAGRMAFGSLTLWLVVELVKALIHRPRPFTRQGQARVVGMRALGRSFPSGHTSQAFFQTALLVRYFSLDLWASGLLLTLALLVGVTRMYVGAHYPRDVLAGMILGSVFGFIAAVV